MFPHPVTPPQQKQQQQQQMNYNAAKSGVATVEESDFVSYDYGSSDDDASVVVRPYEVPSQVNKTRKIKYFRPIHRYIIEGDTADHLPTNVRRLGAFISIFV